MPFKLLLLLACLAWDEVRALSLHQRDVPAVVKLPITRRTDNPTRLEKRTSNVSTFFEVELPVYDPLYYSNLTIGTPPQTIQFGLDTSSGYLQTTATNATWCTYSSCASGFFDVNASSTYKFANGNFNVTYFTLNDVFTGDFGDDVVVIDGVTLSAMDLAVNYGPMPNSILGLGYISGKTSEAPATILQALVNGGHINSAAYSLWVDGSTDTGTEGAILFGGVDTAKYSGDLHTMSIPASNGIHYLPVVLVTEITLQNGTSNSQTSGLPEYMVLDSMVSQTFLPNDIVEGLYQDLGIWWDSDSQVGVIDCTTKQKDYNIKFTFINFSISSPVSDFIGPGNSGDCDFNIVPNFGVPSVLGSNFLRNAYVVYDLSNNEISMAPTNFDESEGQVLEIGSGATSISGVFETATAVATVPTAAVSPTGVWVFPAKSTSSALTASSTSTSMGVAAAPTANSKNIMAGIVGAGLVIAL
ncbi:uncharacterized protein N7483_004483 [Penicillium malachiteum]|uniref:uncharacterized protein n=1 Tax=Penicillium malachiteum TaxID=1324776 RepID=UPI0025494CB3|nr:uncharacterized protein N7483_004483 [Penicillium malachiteum]KAJ5729975.1 hypothetical protein N7483_004483 [Penicillium malachiteum]